MRAKLAVGTTLLSSTLLAVGQQAAPMRLRIDLTDAPRHVIHVAEQIPVHEGVNDFWYPQWIPGQELAGGAIDNLTGLTFRAVDPGGARIPWRRDLVDPYEFHVQVPAGVPALAVAFDVLDVPSRFNSVGTAATTSHVVMLEPSDVVLYPTHRAVNTIPVTATVHLPDTWKAATALRVDETAPPTLNGPETTFRTVSLEQFVDSPILAGDHCRQYPLAPELRPVHMLDICADNDSSLELKPEFLSHMTELVRQERKVFGNPPYSHYDFLVGLSPHLAGDSTEHTQSAHYIVKGSKIDDGAVADFTGYLLPHEYTHAWCGKYRRPAGIATPNFNTPMQNDLLWVYEGMTEYYGDILSARAGFYTPEQVVNRFDYAVFEVDKPGRLWRSVQDTADASAVLRGVDSAWANWRLTQNYYQEGALLWLEADVKIRQLSHGTKSLDDFAALFFQSRMPQDQLRSAGPTVVPYTFSDIVQALNTVQPYDWDGFWRTHLNALTPRPPTAGLQAAGYDYVYSDAMSAAEAGPIQRAHMAEMYHSLGFQVLPDGTLLDVFMGSPAFAAGLGPGDKLTKVGGKPYTAEELTEAVRTSRTDAQPISLTATRDNEAKSFTIQYHNGLKFSNLQRNKQPDLLTTAILRPR